MIYFHIMCIFTTHTYLYFNISFSDDGTCKHAVALLFGCVDFNLRYLDRHTQVGTDIQCKWSQARRESKPVPVSELDLRRNTDTPLIEPTPLHYVPLRARPLSKDDIDQQVFKLLREHAPNASVLRVMDVPDDTSVEESKAMPLASLADEYKQVNDTDNITDMPSFIDYVRERLTPKDIAEIAEIPQGTDEWYSHREGRLTGSIMGKVLKFRMSNKMDNSLVRSVLSKSHDEINAPALNYGRDYEPVARTLYLEEKNKECHTKLTIAETGLVIDPTVPIMGASPDGIISCACCEKAILEIKCCHSRQNELVKDIAQSGTYHVYLDGNGDMKLKETSPWYSQIVAEMAITGCERGVLVVFTNKGIESCDVQFSPDHWQTLKQKCLAVYETFILPKL